MNDAKKINDIENKRVAMQDKGHGKQVMMS